MSVSTLDTSLPLTEPKRAHYQPRTEDEQMRYQTVVSGIVVAAWMLLATTSAVHAQFSQNAGNARFLYLAAQRDLGTSGTQFQVLSEDTTVSAGSSAKTITVSVVLLNTGTTNGFAECTLLNTVGNVSKADINLAPNTIGTVSLVLATPSRPSSIPTPTTLNCGALGANIRVTSAMAVINFVNNLQFQSCNSQGDCSP